MSRSNDSDDTIRRHSGWLIPLGVFLVTLALSAMFLLYYLAPTAPPLFAEQSSPVSDTDTVALEVNGLRLWIPANYLEFESARRGGQRRQVSLFAMLPDLTGWSNWDSQAFAGNGPNSRIVHIVIRQDNVSLSEAEKLQRIYLAYVTEPKGAPSPFDLTRYAFREDSGYRKQDLFVGETRSGVAALRCERLTAENPSPSCIRDMPLGKGAAISYRFKRSRLNHWREIGEGVEKLMASFKTAPK